MQIKNLIQRARALPLSVSLPLGFILLVLILSLAAGVRRVASPATKPPAPVATAAPVPAQRASTAIRPPEPVGALPTASAAPAAASTASPLPSSAPAAAPPAGIAPGWVESTVDQKDQFGQFAQQSKVAVVVQSTAFESQNPASGGPDWRQTWAGWFRLSSPARVGILRASGVGVASGEVDGQSLGQPLNSGPAGVSTTASVALAPGWHEFTVTVSRLGWMQLPAGIAVQLAIGDGVTPAAPVVPYSIPARALPVAAVKLATAHPQTAAVAVKPTGGGNENRAEAVYPHSRVGWRGSRAHCVFLHRCFVAANGCCRDGADFFQTPVAPRWRARLSVLATSTSWLLNYAAVDAKDSDRPRFSLRRWLTHEAHDNVRTVILNAHAVYQTAAESIFGSMLSTVAAVASSPVLPEISAEAAGGYWVILDEFPQLGATALTKIQQIAELGRSRGMRMVTALQDEAQLAAKVGAEKAAPMLSMQSTRIYMRSSDKTAEAVSKRIGEREVLRIETTADSGAVQGKTKRVTREPVIEPGQILGLRVRHDDEQPGVELIMHIEDTIGRLVQPFSPRVSDGAQRLIESLSWREGALPPAAPAMPSAAADAKASASSLPPGFDDDDADEDGGSTPVSFY